MVTTHSDVSNAGSGKIITDGERTAIGTNTTKTGITSEQATAITTNTAKVTNATHTGDVTGATALTITTDAVSADELASSGVTAGTYGSATLSPVITVDEDGRVTIATTATISTGLPTTPATGTMTYWDGNTWVSITPGSDNQKLTFCDGQPTWTADGICPTIGNFYEGGVIFHLFVDGEAGYVAGETHGLIAAPMDQTGDNGIIWGCNETDITAVPNVITSLPSGNGSEIGDGATNTASIVDVANGGCSEAGAAKLCVDLELNGFSDWFLPSILEFKKMVAEKDNINTAGGSTFNEANNAPTFGRYWSSTEVNSFFAWSYDFPNGYSFNDVKPDTYRVRAVRAF